MRPVRRRGPLGPTGRAGAIAPRPRSLVPQSVPGPTSSG